MSFLSDNIIPGDRGRTFKTNAVTREELLQIMEQVASLEGVVHVDGGDERIPKKITVYTNRVIKVQRLEEVVNAIGLHLIPNGIFQE